jgi:CBS domain-containing protein
MPAPKFFAVDCAAAHPVLAESFPRRAVKPFVMDFQKQEDAMRIRQIMTPKIETIGPNASIQEAARKMRDLNIGCLAVTENNTLAGIVTDRDICCRAVGDGKDPVQTPVHDIMSRDVMCCYDDQDVTEAAQLMEDKHLRRLAVLNREKDLVGFVSVDDLALYSHDLAGEVLEASSPVPH